MGDDLGDHRVVVRRHRVAAAHSAVDTQVCRFSGRRKVREHPGRGPEAALRVLGVDPCFHRVTPDREVGLCGRERLAGRHPELPLHQIGAGHHLGYRVLDLKPGVHFHEPEPVFAQTLGCVRDELHGAGAAVVDGPRRGDRGLAHGCAHRRGHARCRGFLDDLLVAALQRAVPLEEVYRVAMRIGEHLDLDMARPRDPALDQHPIVAEARAGLASRTFERIAEFGFGVGAPHPLAAAARHRLHQHREPDAAGVGEQCGIVLRLAVVTGDHRHPGRFHQALCGILQAHGADRGGRRADEDDAGGGAGFDECRVLRQEPVPRMHRVRPRCGGGGDGPLDVQIALRRRGGAEPARLVRGGDVQCVPVRIGVHRHGADAEPVRGAHHPAGDLAPVGDEEPAEHHIRNTPKRVSSMGALSAAESERASTSRVRAGWTMPSSHSRALA